MEAIGDNEELLQKAADVFESMDDEALNSPEGELLVEQFASENEVPLTEGYDISKLNLKKGTTIDLTDLEDVLNLTGGKFRRELALYMNDGGVISVTVKKESSTNVNGIVVEVSAIDGQSVLGKEGEITKLLKNTLENGDLSFLMESEDVPHETPDVSGIPADRQLFEYLPSVVIESAIDKGITDEGKKTELLESFQTAKMNYPFFGDDKIAKIDTPEIKRLFEDEAFQPILESLNQAFEIDTPFQDGKRIPNVGIPEIKRLFEDFDHTIEPSETEGVYLAKEGSDCVGVYNATTGTLDCKPQTRLYDEAEDHISGQRGDSDDQPLFEASELVRVNKKGSETVFKHFKSAGLDFSKSTGNNPSFDEFYVTGVKRKDLSNMVKKLRDKGTPVVLVESVGQEPKQYSDVIVKNGDGDVLLLKRSSNDTLQPSKLGFAGGKIEEGEEPMDAGVRELYEETGIEVDDLIFVETHTNADGSTSHYFETTIEDPSVVLSEEHDEHVWVSPDKMLEQDIIFDNADRYVELIESGGKKPAFLKESRTPKRIYKLKESVSRDMFTNAMFENDEDFIEDSIEPVDHDSEDLEYVSEAVEAGDMDVVANGNDNSLVSDGDEDFFVEY